MASAVKSPKYPRPCCAACGQPIFGAGWFCSYRCESGEYTERARVSREKYEAGTPIKRKTTG